MYVYVWVCVCIYRHTFAISGSCGIFLGTKIFIILFFLFLMAFGGFHRVFYAEFPYKFTKFTKPQKLLADLKS